MLLYSLQVIVKEKIQKITSSDFRRFILAITDGFTDELKSKINFHITDESFKWLLGNIWEKCDKEF